MCGTQALVTLPALGAVTLLPAGGGQSQPRAFAKRLEAGVLLQNERVAMQVDRQGRVISYTLDGREMAAGRPMNVLRMYKDVPRIFDAWDIDSNYREQEACTARADTLEPVSYTHLDVYKRQRPCSRSLRQPAFPAAGWDPPLF